jgi:hypothetical protein
LNGCICISQFMFVGIPLIVCFEGRVWIPATMIPSQNMNHRLNKDQLQYAFHFLPTSCVNFLYFVF